MSRRILLDTHIALWAVTGSGRLSATARQLILDAHEVQVSAASVWEIAITHALGRGDMPVSSEQALQAFRDSGYALLAIKPEHAVRVADLPAIHADPFDRLLIAQAVTEPLRLLTADTALLRYGEMIVRV